MQRGREIWESLYGYTSKNWVYLCYEEDKEGISQVHPGTVYSRSEDTALLQSPQTSENLWLFFRLRVFLHAFIVHGGRQFVFSHEEESKA